MKLAAFQIFVITSLFLGLSAPAEAQRIELEVTVGYPDDYVVVERNQPGVVIVEEPAPRVVIGHAPPPPPRRVVVRPEPTCSGAIWVDGYWRHNGVRFVWVDGHWVAPRYGYRFVQPRWHVHAGYHYYTPGYFRPAYAQVRRPTYQRYRPRPGYVYYRGYQTPDHRRHHPPGHYRHVKHPGRGHYKHAQRHGRGLDIRVDHRGRGHTKPSKHPSRADHRQHTQPSRRHVERRATPVRQPTVSRSRTRPSNTRVDTRGSRTASSGGSGRVATVSRR
jgi:hypothetical protein